VNCGVVDTALLLLCINNLLLLLLLLPWQLRTTWNRILTLADFVRRVAGSTGTTLTRGCVVNVLRIT